MAYTTSTWLLSRFETGSLSYVALVVLELTEILLPLPHYTQLSLFLKHSFILCSPRWPRTHEAQVIVKFKEIFPGSDTILVWLNICLYNKHHISKHWFLFHRDNSYILEVVIFEH